MLKQTLILTFSRSTGRRDRRKNSKYAGVACLDIGAI
jgi:hypothetical protein